MAIKSGKWLFSGQILFSGTRTGYGKSNTASQAAPKDTPKPDATVTAIGEVYMYLVCVYVTSIAQYPFGIWQRKAVVSVDSLINVCQSVYT